MSELNDAAPMTTAPPTSASDAPGPTSEGTAVDRVRALVEAGVTTTSVLRVKLGMTTAQVSSALQSLVNARVIVRTGRGAFVKTSDASGRDVRRRPNGARHKNSSNAVVQAALAGLQDLSVSPNSAKAVALSPSTTSADGIAALERRIATVRAELSGLEQALRIVRGLGLIEDE